MLSGVAPEVHLRNSTQARKCASEISTLVLKPMADITRSPKQGYQWPHKKDSCPTKYKKKTTQLINWKGSDAAKGSWFKTQGRRHQKSKNYGYQCLTNDCLFSNLKKIYNELTPVSESKSLRKLLFPQFPLPLIISTLLKVITSDF